MILALQPHPVSRLEDLLARTGSGGKPEVRGPLVQGPFSEEQKPLADLRDGDKLHIVRDPADNAAGLVDLLEQLGLTGRVRLKQIHLLIDNSGTGKRRSFAERFYAELMRRNYPALEIKAACGRVRWDERGKVWISPANGDEWLPSSPELNYYTGTGRHIATG